MVFNGNTSSTAISTASQNATDIVSYTVANRSGGGITASIGIFLGSSITYILFNKSLAAGETYVYPGERIRVLPEHQIFVSVSGSADYYFTILPPR